MSDAAGALHARYVILPWARPYDPNVRETEPAQRRVAQDVDVVRVRGEGMSVESRQIATGTPTRFRNVTQQPLAPPLLAAGLPARPMPSIPEADRAPLAAETLMSAAVALDVLSSRTHHLEARGDILHRLTTVLLEVGQLGGIDDAAVERLLRHAASQAGSNRAALSRRLAAATSTDRDAKASTGGVNIPTTDAPRSTAVPAQATGPRSTAPRSSPEGVATSLRDLGAAAHIVVREAVLLLDAHEPVSYRQA